MYDDAIAILEQVLARAPNRLQTAILLSLARQMAKGPADGEKALPSVVNADPSAGEPHVTLARSSPRGKSNAKDAHCPAN